MGEESVVASVVREKEEVDGGGDEYENDEASDAGNQFGSGERGGQAACEVVCQASVKKMFSVAMMMNSLVAVW